MSGSCIPLPLLMKLGRAAGQWSCGGGHGARAADKKGHSPVGVEWP